MSNPDVSAPRLELSLQVRAQVGTPVDLGVVRGGRRRVVPILSGTFEGFGIKGRVLPGGADWQLIHEDGLTEVDARYTLEGDCQELIYVQNVGIRHAPRAVMEKLLAGEPVDPSLVYFCSRPTFETSAPDLESLTRFVFVGIGERYPTEVVMRFWKVG
jgi:uncharacterized protein DUF3237